jgi:hypothetical protein
MRDAGEHDQLSVHSGFLQFRNSRLGWLKRRDLVVARMNRQNRKPPAGGGCRRPAAVGDRGRQSGARGRLYLLCGGLSEGARAASTASSVRHGRATSRP